MSLAADDAWLTERAPRPDDDLRVRRIAQHVRGIMDALGLDRTDPNLAGTDARVARAYLELFAGLEPGAEPELTTFPAEGHGEMVVVRDVGFYSLCAHHFLPFFGRIHVGYVPRGRIVGLSKVARVVDYFARRPQVQERLTEQIAEFLADRLETRGVMVVSEARHLCMEMRGAHASGVETTTTATRGVFRQAAMRRELFDRLGRAA